MPAPSGAEGARATGTVAHLKIARIKHHGQTRYRVNDPQLTPKRAAHSFASYHFAKHKNENETAALMGNSPQMIF